MKAGSSWKWRGTQAQNRTNRKPDPGFTTRAHPQTFLMGLHIYLEEEFHTRPVMELLQNSESTLRAQDSQLEAVRSWNE